MRMATKKRAARSWFSLGGPDEMLTTAAALGAVAVGAVLFEAALIPGLAIGAAVVLAPRVLGAGARRGKPRGSAPLQGLEKLRPGKALVKTVTFRVIVTTLDFGANYFVLGDVATAAGLSAFSLVAGPAFYFLHEAGWDYFGDRIELRDADGRVRLLGVRMSRTLAKTITYRAVATVSEFTATYIVVQDLATAALLASFGFVLGPFVYYAHERVWEVFGPDSPAPTLLALPRPAAA
jgi:uncharacterized membrane protein